MTGKVLTLEDILNEDQLACAISEHWMDWNLRRQKKIADSREVRSYIYATDTTQTTNAQLPWSNKTTLPKLCQVRDNLFANYMATMFPKRKWLKWEGWSEDDENKKAAVLDYIFWVVSQKEFKDTIKKLVLDYIDYGNCFVTLEWVDETTVGNDGVTKIGFTGPRAVRINPLDIVMNPTAPSFSSTPKIVRALMSMGEAEKLLSQYTTEEADQTIAKEVFDYCKELRNRTSSESITDFATHNEYYAIDGFDSYVSYLGSNYVELLFFYGDMYDKDKDKFYQNHMFVVMDRHKLVYNGKHPYPMAEIPMYHTGWRVRQDNLWAMGPLDNLVGLQYRLDHVENMKADMLDLTAFPPVKIKGIVNDFEWGPLEKIYVDQDGDVDLMSPRPEVLQNNIEIQQIEARIEEMAGSPKEAMGFRTPGEKTAYEVQRLENAASRIFQNKISQFEEQIIEPLLNAMLVMAQKHTNDVTIRTIDEEFKAVEFRTLTPHEISANGRIRPIAARHFAEKAEMVQNLNNFVSSPLYADPEIKVHFSSIKLSEMMEEILGIEDFDMVKPFIRLSEGAEAQQLQNTHDEETLAQTDTPAGLVPGDTT